MLKTHQLSLYERKYSVIVVKWKRRVPWNLPSVWIPVLNTILDCWGHVEWGVTETKKRALNEALSLLHGCKMQSVLSGCCLWVLRLLPNPRWLPESLHERDWYWVPGSAEFTNLVVSTAGSMFATSNFAGTFDYMSMGSLDDPLKITYTGEQVAQWDFQNNATRTSSPGPAFVLEVPLCHLLAHQYM